MNHCVLSSKDKLTHHLLVYQERWAKVTSFLSGVKFLTDTFQWRSVFETLLAYFTCPSGKQLVLDRWTSGVPNTRKCQPLLIEAWNITVEASSCIILMAITAIYFHNGCFNLIWTSLSIIVKSCSQIQCTIVLFKCRNSWCTGTLFKQDNYSIVGGDGDVGSASTTSPMSTIRVLTLKCWIPENLLVPVT